MTVESGESEVPEEQGVPAPSETPMQPSGEMTEAQTSEATTVPPTEAPSRRTQLKIVRESVESLEREVGNFRRKSEADAKKMQAHLASLRKDMTTHMRSKELGNHAKRHESDSKRLEKQIAGLRGDLASLKSQMAKEAAKSRAREEALVSKIAAKVRKAEPSRKPKKKVSKSKR